MAGQSVCRACVGLPACGQFLAKVSERDCVWVDHGF